jgi:hypothetical protein
MDFMKLLKSFEDLLYEVLSWFVFYPLTLWRSVRRPQTAMRRAIATAGAAETADDDTLSPPLFLLVTLLIAHGIEIGVVRGAGSELLPTLLQKDSNLLLLRAVAFSIFPLVMAVVWLRQRGAAVNRGTLRAPFYGQCCLAAPAALAISVGVLVARVPHGAAAVAGVAIVAVATVWYIAVETRWFADELSCSRARAASLAILAYLTALAIFFAVNLLVFLSMPAKG